MQFCAPFIVTFIVDKNNWTDIFIDYTLLCSAKV